MASMFRHIRVSHSRFVLKHTVLQCPLWRQSGCVSTYGFPSRALSFSSPRLRWNVEGARMGGLKTVGSVSADAVLVKLQKALEFEADKGYTNIQGRQHLFADFARSTVNDLSPPLGLQRDHSTLSVGFTHYESLDPDARQALVERGLLFVHKWATFQELDQGQAASKQGAMDTAKPIQQQDEKQPTALPNHPENDPNQPERSTSYSPASQNPTYESARKMPPGKDDRELSMSDTESSPSSVSPTGRPIKQETLRAQRIFREFADKSASEVPFNVDELKEIEQRSPEWKMLRERRLTASYFGTLLGFWGSDRILEVWEEKLGLRQPFAGNMRTRWGTRQEPVALSDYKKFTGLTVEQCGFKVLGNDKVHDWLGASPDGIIVDPKHQGVTDFVGNGNGILEIKCPYSQDGPPELMKSYYYPQVQGLMDIFDSEWCHMFYWTTAGASLFYVERDRQFWTNAYSVFAEFWWENVVPARLVLESGGCPEDVEEFKPIVNEDRLKNLRNDCVIRTQEVPKQLLGVKVEGLGAFE